MSTVIKAENLGKKYIIGHQKQRYDDSLRDAMTHTARGIWQRIRHPLSPNRESIDLEELWALKDVNFEVQEGERVGIIGRNGAGKSTLLKILSRITEPTTGKVRIKGRVSSLLEVGTGFHPELTGRENVFLNGAILGMTRQEIRKKFDEIVAFAELEKFLDTPVKRYSSGMYVRLAFAVAAHLEPEILLVDEVLAVGDASFQKKCLGKMDEVAKGGRTVLFVSHNMAAIESLCPTSILLDNGMVVAYGPTSDNIASYLSMSNSKITESRQRIGELIRSADEPGLIRRAVLLDSRQEVTGQIRVGDACEFQVELESTEVIFDVAVGLHIKTSESMQRVTSFHTRYHRCPMTNLNGRTTWRCRCPEFMLVPGSYVLELAVASSGRIVDRLDHVFSFSVIDADVLGTGKVPPLKDGIAVSKGYWEVS